MDKTDRWLEVSMTVDGELAEAVSEVLGRFTSNGVVVESGVSYNTLQDMGTMAGPVRVYGYLVMDEAIEDTRQQLEKALWYLGRIQALPEPAYRTIADEDWMAAWKKHYRPIPIGKRLLILPAWIKNEQTERIAVHIDPSMAFGTGTHPTTQLCLEAVEEYLEAGVNVIDVGCGSGILSIAALKLGAAHALGVDTDRAAVLASRENAAANGTFDRIEVGTGSVTEIRDGLYSIRQAPFVLANILAPVIIQLFEDGLSELVEPGGQLVLSGILDKQCAAVESAAQNHGMVLKEKKQISDWAALVLKKLNP